jgi:hypothetical protein
MKTYFFIKTEPTLNKTWADVCEGLNSYYAGPNPGFYSTDLGGYTNQEQQIYSYVKIDKKLGLYKTEQNKLAIAVTSPVVGQTLGVNELDLNMIKEKLDSGVKTVYFGYLFKNESVSQVEVVDKSIYFGRNPLDNVLTDFTNNKPLEGNISSAIWMAFYKLKNSSVYFVVLNDTLVDSTVVRETVSDADLKTDDAIIEFVNSHDGTFKDAIFKPTVTGGSFFGKNLIVTSEDEITVDVFGRSAFHMINGGAILKDEELPEIDLSVESSSPVTINKNKINVSVSAPLSTLQYKWNTGSELDFISSEENKLQYDFVIVKL